MSTNAEPASAPASTSQSVRYRRVVLKISGEALRCPDGNEPIHSGILERFSRQLKEVHETGVEIALVVGGGNIFRGLTAATGKGIDRTTGDYMGMLATVINGLAFMDCLEKLGVIVRVMTSIPMEAVAEPFILRRAIRHMERGRLVIFVGGTGNPYFSTDTAAALRASEIEADAILKATKVDGIYDKDPLKHPDAVKYRTLSYSEALQKQLSVMDSTAFSLCRDNSVPIMVFNLFEEDGIRRAVQGDTSIGTLVN